MEGYLTVGEAAERWGVSERRISQYCAQGLIVNVNEKVSQALMKF